MLQENLDSEENEALKALHVVELSDEVIMFANALETAKSRCPMYHIDHSSSKDAGCVLLTNPD